MTYYAIPGSLDAEIDELDVLVRSFSEKSIDAAQLKAHRVPFGIYEQRRDGSYMVRVRCTGGAITPQQCRLLADAVRRLGLDTLHLTTRQELQVHDVALDQIVPLIRELRTAGLSSRGGGGNTVRNIMASYDSGISPDDAFDVLPWVSAVTDRLIADRESWRLPRKFKISFASREPDNALARFNDLGFVARRAEGIDGFAVYVAGGMGSRPQVGYCLHSFVKADEAYRVIEAVKRLFSTHGNRRNKHAARLRFLWNSLGRERFEQLYHEEYARLSSEKDTVLVSRALHAPAPVEGEATAAQGDDSSNGFGLWRKRYVQPQRQAGLFSIRIPVFLGVVPATVLKALSEWLETVGPDTLRLTMDQNLHVRNIPSLRLTEAWRVITGLFELAEKPRLWSNIVACAGASTCRLGICKPRGLVTALRTRMENSGVNLERFADLAINISGCPNTCGQHLLGDIGLCGKVARFQDDIYPAYSVFTTAKRNTDKAAFGERAGEVAARSAPALLEEVLGIVTDAHSGTSLGETVMHALQTTRGVPALQDDPAFYYDWGSREPFSLKGKGAGECSAGIFDLIDLDLATARSLREKAGAEGDDAAREILRRAMVVSASRALLVIKGIEASTTDKVVDAFSENFVQTGLIGTHYDAVLHAVRENRPLPRDTVAESLVDNVQKLYDSLDDSLTLRIDGAAPVAPSVAPGATVVKDLRGVACPMNFVKTKMELARVRPGELLEIFLDDGAPVENVPRSVAAEGHDVVSQQRRGAYWAVQIRKARPDA